MPVTAAMAQENFTVCDKTSPFEKEVIDENPVYWGACSNTPVLCSRPTAPVVVEDPAKNWTRAQGVVLRATVPADFYADRAMWKAYGLWNPMM